MYLIKKFRQANKVSQVCLGLEANLYPSTLSNYETGFRKPSIETGHRIIKAMNNLGIECSFVDVFPPQAANDSDKSPDAA
ncbi:MAG: putative transcriptional regulator [Psychroserpens sp.]|jgi:putative transcriptional regulator